MDIVLGIIAFLLTLIVGILLVVWSEYKKYTSLQKAYFWYNKAKPGCSKKKALAEILDRLIIAELDKCTDSHKLKAMYDDMTYWTPESSDNEGLPVIDFFNKRFAELTAKEEDEEDRLRAKRKSEENELESASMERVLSATSVKDAQTAYKTAPLFSDSKRIAKERWKWLSLIAVLNAKTLEELREAKSEAPEDSLALKFVPYTHELLSRIAVDTANTVEELISAGDNAPEKALPDTALYVCFQKLHQRLKTQPITIKKVA